MSKQNKFVLNSNLNFIQLKLFDFSEEKIDYEKIISERLNKSPNIENTKPGKGNEIQLTDALLELIKHEAMYAYDFEGRRYDVGDKLGFLQATVEYALRKEELRDGFIEYLRTIIK